MKSARSASVAVTGALRPPPAGIPRQDGAQPDRRGSQRQLDQGRLPHGQDAFFDEYSALLARYGHSARDAPPGARLMQLRMFYIPDEPAEPTEPES